MIAAKIGPFLLTSAMGVVGGSKLLTAQEEGKIYVEFSPHCLITTMHTCLMQESANFRKTDHK